MLKGMCPISGSTISGNRPQVMVAVSSLDRILPSAAFSATMFAAVVAAASRGYNAACSIIDSTISGNSASGGGGAHVGTGSTIITRSTISGNTFAIAAAGSTACSGGQYGQYHQRKHCSWERRWNLWRRYSR